MCAFFQEGPDKSLYRSSYGSGLGPPVESPGVAWLELSQFVRMAGPALPDHYAVLGLAPSATAEEIKAAFKAQALKTHPDKGGSAAMFRPQETEAALLPVERKSWRLASS